MVNDDKKPFFEELTVLGELYNKEISTAKARIYFMDLAEFNFDDVSRAMSAHRKDPDQGRFFPTPAHLIKQIQGSGAANAMQAWEEVVRLASNSAAAKSDDLALEAAVKTVGGWRKIGQTQNSQLQWVRKDFLVAYEEFKSSPHLIDKRSTKSIERTNGPRRIGEQSNVRGIR